MAVPADNTTRATARSSLWRKPHSEHLLSLLASLNGPRDLRKLDDEQLQELCADIRGTIIETVAKTGGHLGSSLGVVELTVALHRLLDSPDRPDRVGHRSPGVRAQAADRPPRRTSARCASWAASVASRDGARVRTTCWTAATPARACRSRRAWRSPASSAARNEKIAVVVGDAALMSGMALEALNDIGQRKTQLLIVLNDNEMSISPTVGAISQYLSRIKLSRTWRGIEARLRGHRRAHARSLARGSSYWSRRLRKSVVNFAQPGQLFEDLGITYVGPVPGHNLRGAPATSSGARCATWTAR